MPPACELRESRGLAHARHPRHQNDRHDLSVFRGPAAVDRIINEHDEADENEELYLVHQGHATFELGGERVDAPAGTFVFAGPGVKRTAFAEAPDLLYNVACCESLAGQKTEAIGHLRRAIEGSERFRAFAAGDSDFDAINGEPTFKELVG